MKFSVKTILFSVFFLFYISLFHTMYSQELPDLDEFVGLINDTDTKELEAKKELELADFTKYFDISSIPDAMLPIFRALKIRDYSLETPENKVIVRGKTDIFDGVVDVQLMFSDEKGERDLNLKIAVPSGWKLSRLFPSIKALEKFTLPTGSFIISSQEFFDPDLNILVKKGLTFVSEIRPADLKIDTKIVGKIGDIIGKIVDKFLVKLYIPKKISDFDLIIDVPVSKDREIRFSDLIDVANVPMPPKVRTSFENLKLAKPQFVIELEKGNLKDVFVTAGMNIFGQDVVANFYLKTKESGKIGVSAVLRLTSNWKFSDVVPELAQLDQIKFDDSQFIISSFDYEDERLGIEIKEGFTFDAGVELTGVLEGVKKFIDKILTNKKLQQAGGMSKTLVLDELSLRAYGSLKPDVTKSEFFIEIPIQIGIDFTELHRQGKIKGEPIIKKLTTSKFKFILTPDLKVTANAGIFIYPKGQEKALEFIAGGGVSPFELSLSGQMTGTFDPAFGQQWLSFADLGLELVWNYEISTSIAAVTGVPLPTGITMAGTLGLGKVPNRTTGKGAIKLEVSTNAKDINFFINGEIDQINITELIKVLSSMDKKPVNIGKLPSILFSDLKLMVAPFNTVIFDKEYKAGIDASAKIKIDDFLASGHVSLSKADERLLVEAFVTPFKTKVFELTGLGPDKIPGTEDDGASFKIDIAAGKKPNEQEILIDGTVVIPPIKYEGSVLFEMAGGIIDGSGTGKWLDVVDARASFKANIDDPLDWALDLGLESGFSDYVKGKLPAAFAKFKEQAQKDIKRYNDEIEKIQKGFGSKSQAELDRVEKQLKKLNDQLRKIKLKPVGKLGVAGPSLLHIFNYSPNTLHVGLYSSGTSGPLGQKSVGPSVLSGSIISIPGYSKAQLSRPKLQMGKNRDIVYSFNKNDLKNNFTKDEFAQRMHRNVGELQGALFHIYRQDDDSPYRAYGGVEWDLGDGAAINIKIAQLATEIAGLQTYKEALLKPGSVVVDRLLEGLQQLKAVPEIFVKATDALVGLITKASGAFNLKQASLATSGLELKALKLPKISMNLEININDKNIVINVPSLQFDVKKPHIFFADLATIILTAVVQQGYGVPLADTQAEIEALEDL